ncbi:hypothetical protein OH77DRAFT_644616 [Trametes cingulata]|nr:hypothetical protein OH77DRAFT_644616 [Trametes cingulata]
MRAADDPWRRKFCRITAYSGRTGPGGVDVCASLSGRLVPVKSRSALQCCFDPASPLRKRRSALRLIGNAAVVSTCWGRAGHGDGHGTGRVHKPDASPASRMHASTCRPARLASGSRNAMRGAAPTAFHSWALGGLLVEVAARAQASARWR